MCPGKPNNTFRVILPIVALLLFSIMSSLFIFQALSAKNNRFAQKGSNESTVIVEWHTAFTWRSRDLRRTLQTPRFHPGMPENRTPEASDLRRNTPVNGIGLIQCIGSYIYITPMQKERCVH